MTATPAACARLAATASGDTVTFATGLVGSVDLQLTTDSDLQGQSAAGAIVNDGILSRADDPFADDQATGGPRAGPQGDASGLAQGARHALPAGRRRHAAAGAGAGRPGIEAPGQVGDLAAALDRVRLTVAPLRHGVGVRGKVPDSRAAGVPLRCRRSRPRTGRAPFRAARRARSATAMRIKPWHGWDKPGLCPAPAAAAEPGPRFYGVPFSDCRMHRSMVSTMIRVWSSTS